MTDDPNDSPTSWPRHKKMALWVPASAHCGCSAIGLGANESKRIVSMVNHVAGRRSKCFLRPALESAPAGNRRVWSR